ncbi:hypothetical protein ACRE_059530 [Hapsidospora chrysogenum ATCC 11550]|uniref:Uncharacterized protein n=1 Tax=Hapsidospora chrysogenum (strain ATCC 11550 / CBS 779.69 / DSM 880 / IAM 14645 / JCM 23072 / IMI 49137) TaxID=857340 RepID=A0A086T1U9_HAPC1|nr:hypothetical protein ACRE_059530 [Hapsidospora chrysogenum ATCC 11550]
MSAHAARPAAKARINARREELYGLALQISGGHKPVRAFAGDEENIHYIAPPRPLSSVPLFVRSHTKTPEAVLEASTVSALG